MKKFKLKIKLLVYGFPPFNETFVMDNFKLNTEQMDYTLIKNITEKNPFIPSWYIYNCTFQLKNDENIYYNFFESIEEIQYNISNSKAKNNNFIIQYFSSLNDIEYTINNFKKKLRLIYNLRIIFPIYKVTIFDTNNKFIGHFIKANDFPSKLGLDSNFDKEKVSKNSRTGFDLKSFLLTEKNNVKFSRAVSLFNDSFESSDVSIRFLLLFSCLESLFITSKKDITNNLALCTSRILLYESEEDEITMYERIKNLYNCRCKFIHGKKLNNISHDLEIELRDIVRYVLLIYWNLCLQGKNSNEIIKMLKNKEKIPLQTKMYAKVLKSDDYQEAYKELLNIIALEIAKGNVRIKEQENGVIKSVEEL